MNVKETLALLWNVIFHRSAVTFASTAKVIDFVRHVIILGAVGVIVLILLTAFLGAGGIAPAVIVVATVIVGCYALTVPEILIAWFLGHGMVNGMPNIKIGQVLAAPFSGEIELPDFKTSEFIEAGLKGLVTLMRLFGHAVIALGVFAAATQVVSIMMPPVPGRFGGVFSVIAGVVLFIAIAVRWPRKSTAYRRIAIVAATAQIALGLFIMTHPISNLQKIERQVIKNLWTMEEKSLEDFYTELQRSKGLPNDTTFDTMADIQLRRDAQSFWSHLKSIAVGKTALVTFDGKSDVVQIAGIPDGRSTFEIVGDPKLVILRADGSVYNKYGVADGGENTIVIGDSVRVGGETFVRFGKATTRLVLSDSLEKEIASGNLKIGELTARIKIRRTI